jgi:hypothetical protein
MWPACAPLRRRPGVLDAQLQVLDVVDGLVQKHADVVVIQAVDDALAGAAAGDQADAVKDLQAPGQRVLLVGGVGPGTGFAGHGLACGQAVLMFAHCNGQLVRYVFSSVGYPTLWRQTALAVELCQRAAEISGQVLPGSYRPGSRAGSVRR